MSTPTETASPPKLDTVSEVPPETPTESPKQSRGKAIKYGIIKTIDFSGLTFLTPIVRLSTGEEPAKQLKKIVQFIVVPCLAILIFLLAWSWIAPKHKTKSGEVPTPSVVMDAAENIWTFHKREGFKEAAYNLDDPQREAFLKAVESRLAVLTPIEQRVNATVEKVRSESEAATDEDVKPIVERYEQLKVRYEEDAASREETLAKQAGSLDTSDEQGRSEYLAAVREHLDQIETEQDELGELLARADAIRRDANPELKTALAMQTKVAEEVQYLRKMADLLGRANRNVRLASAEDRLTDQEAELTEATTESDRFTKAKAIASSQQRIDRMAEAEYAKPWTLPLQVYRSVACVFCGFLLGTIIAVPIGVLCGLSSTFMAAMTPFIALFKPVSPIVWLPIALIVVGGFIPDPDKHWLITMLAELPLIGWLKINPAFMACAITVALCSLWATMVNTAFGVASIEKDHLNVAAVLRLGFWDRLTKIIIPSALPLIFAGMRISLGVGWMVLIAAELLSSSEGIGKYVWDQFNNGGSDSFAKMIVVVFVVGIVGLILDRIMIVFQRLVSFDESPSMV